MSLKTERTIDKAVTKLNASKLDKLKTWGRKALFTTVSTIALAGGMIGTPQQAQAQNRNVIELSVNDIAAVQANRGTSLENNNQQYAAIYANRDAYYQQQYQQAPYGSRQWLEENGLEYDARLSRNLNRRDYLGAFIDWNSVDRYGMPTQVVYLPRDPVHGKPTSINIDDANKMCEHPGGDALGIYHDPCGADVNNPENNPSWGRGHYHDSRRGRKVRRVLRDVDNAVRTAHNLYHIIRGGR